VRAVVYYVCQCLALEHAELVTITDDGLIADVLAILFPACGWRCPKTWRDVLDPAAPQARAWAADRVGGRPRPRRYPFTPIAPLPRAERDPRQHESRRLSLRVDAQLLAVHQRRRRASLAEPSHPVTPVQREGSCHAAARDC
jgi:hypothetical protein